MSQYIFKGRKNILAVYDNGGVTFARYTVVYGTKLNRYSAGLFDCVAMSENPFHPQGVGQHGSAMIGDHLGEKIPFEKLPARCQKFVSRDLGADRHEK